VAAIVSQVREFPDEEFYAAAFWLCYVDYTMFGPPAIAMNTESPLAAHRGDKPADWYRWWPPEWQFDVLMKPVEAMTPLYRPLPDSPPEGGESIWNPAIEEHLQALARLSRRLTQAARGHSAPFDGIPLPPGLVTGIFDTREGEEEYSTLVKASTEPEIISRLPSPVWEPERIREVPDRARERLLSSCPEDLPVHSP
jgi:hypothetical protein